MSSNVLVRAVGRARPALRRTPTAADAVLEIARFLHSFYVLLRTSRLYHKDHPRVMEALQETEHALRPALELRSPLAFGVEDGRILLQGVNGAARIGHASGKSDEYEALAGELSRCGIQSLIFEAKTSLSELAGLTQLIHHRTANRQSDAEPQWASQLVARRIRGIRVNALAEEKAETALAGLLAELLSCADAQQEDAAAQSSHSSQTAKPANEEELMAAMRLLVRLAPVCSIEGESSLRGTADALRAALQGASRRSIETVARASLRHAPQKGEAPRLYLLRLAESLILEYLGSEFLARRLTAPALRAGLARLAAWTPQILRAVADEPQAAILADWADESYVERLYERVWEAFPPREQSRILQGRDAWCAPLAILRRRLEHALASGGEGSPREARLLLIHYACGLESEDGKARRSVAAGLAEVQPAIERLWPRELPVDLIRCVTHALIAEVSPGIANLLAGVTANLARFALAAGDFAAFERILVALESAPRDEEHARIAAVLARITTGEAWRAVLDQGLSPRPQKKISRANETAIPRLLRRDPERMLDRLGASLAGPRGLDALPSMARLLCAIGEPALGALEARLFEPRQQRAAMAVKLLAAAEPQRLLEALPRALPSWDWSLQDLAISELARPAQRAPLAGLSRVFLQTLPEAHPLAAPVLLDSIGQQPETPAIPLLMEIAEGSRERLRDVFIRIKAIEALGRLRAREAGELLRGILRRRNGLTHTEPAGLRASAEEALALIENRPSSARVRANCQAVEKRGVGFLCPRRYLRIPLAAPLAARIEGPQRTAARVRTISLGGAFLECGRRLAVGDSLRLEIRKGLKRLRATAVVRNVMNTGGGIEFVHMRGEDRERLRRMVRRLSAN